MMMKLHKSRSDRMMFGVCGGIAETLGINSMIVRIVFLVLSMLTRSIVVWIYMLLGMILPYGSAGDDARGGGNPFEGFGGFGGGKKSTGYRPEDPPFDISDAKDVEIDSREDK